MQTFRFVQAAKRRSYHFILQLDALAPARLYFMLQQEFKIVTKKFCHSTVIIRKLQNTAL
jgi:hypothetical protein